MNKRSRHNQSQEFFRSNTQPLDLEKYNFRKFLKSKIHFQRKDKKRIKEEMNKYLESSKYNLKLNCDLPHPYTCFQNKAKITRKFSELPKFVKVQSESSESLQNTTLSNIFFKKESDFRLQRKHLSMSQIYKRSKSNDYTINKGSGSYHSNHSNSSDIKLFSKLKNNQSDSSLKGPILIKDFSKEENKDLVLDLKTPSRVKTTSKNIKNQRRTLKFQNS
ncbi:unnamed protein product [Moneuplotes crassus]|uniref:Uncharacterized protein n=1 Tax=Euplotes crassus TaxID=5936 RepID=A0AAD1UP73_EUPCR|nr:unnamed protein product [Moneuplotes crassus]